MNLALAVCYSGLGLTAGLGILLLLEPGWFTRWLFPPVVEVPAAVTPPVPAVVQ